MCTIDNDDATLAISSPPQRGAVNDCRLRSPSGSPIVDLPLVEQPSGDTCEPVGVIVELVADASGPSSARDYAVPIAMATAGAALTLAAGGWWVRKR